MENRTLLKVSGLCIVVLLLVLTLTLAIPPGKISEKESLELLYNLTKEYLGREPSRDLEKYRSEGKCTAIVNPRPSDVEESNLHYERKIFTIGKGYLNYTPPRYRIVRELPKNVIESLSRQIGVKLYLHEFTIDLKEEEYCSIFQVEAKPIKYLPKTIYILWKLENSKPEVLKHAPLRLSIVEEKEDIKTYKESLKTPNGTVEYEHTRILRYVVVLVEGIPVSELQSYKVVEAEKRDTWSELGFKLAEVWARGRFTYIPGYIVVSVIDLSGEWHAGDVVCCHFSHWVTGVGTPAATVHADAHYFIIIYYDPDTGACIAVHYWTRPRVALDAIDECLDYMNNRVKNFGPCSC